jgi:hypothetical protein
MSKNFKRNFSLLKILSKSSPKTRKEIILRGNKSLIFAVCEACFNCLKGNIRFEKRKREKLRKYRKQFKDLISVDCFKNNCKKQKKIIARNSASFIPLLLTTALSHFLKQN